MIQIKTRNKVSFSLIPALLRYYVWLVWSGMF